MNNIKVFKLINGEELISEVFNSFDQFFELKNPATIMLQPTASGSMGVGIAPYMPYAGDKVNLMKHAIAAEGTPEKQMTDEYLRIFSKIQIAPASVLTGLK